MDFNGFALSRDVLYISGAVTGIAMELLLSLLEKGIDARTRNRRITLALVCLSGTIAGLAISVIVSMGGIFREPAVLATTGLCVAVFALAVRFPRTVAYPLILLGGLAVTWLAVFCLRFPVCDGAPELTLSRVENTEGGAYLIAYTPAMRTAAYPNENDDGGTIRINGTRSFMTFNAALIEIERHYPFIGEKNHGALMRISSDVGMEFSDNSLDSLLVRFAYVRHSGFAQRVLGIGITRMSKTISLDDLSPGTETTVYIDSPDGINHN